MVRIGPTPPQQPFEPERPKKSHKNSKKQQHSASHKPSASKSSDTRKLQRFANLSSAASNVRSQAINPFSYSWGSNVPIRYQWNENNGYCGETCMIASGMSYGQYFSQYDAREIADSMNPKPGHQTDCQLLLGDNDGYTASEMHLNSISYDTSQEKSSTDFLAWVKQMMEKGYPVSIGLYTNENLFYNDPNPDAGQPDYDHIVNVTKIVSKYNDGKYHGDDVIYFSDNGLWSPTGKPQYIFSCTFDQLLKSRQEANDPNGPIYSLANDGANYGIAITGVKDAQHETLPVQVSTNVNAENPEIQDGSNQRPKPTKVELTVTISGLKPGVKYILYRYDKASSVPDSNFNANAKNASQSWPVEIKNGSTFTLNQNIQSDDQVIYRAVPVDAP